MKVKRSVFGMAQIGASIGALLLAACSESALAPDSNAPPAVGSEQQSGTVTAILNAGVMAQFSSQDGQAAKLLFDPIYDDHYGSLAELTPDLIEAIINGAPPYDGAHAVFVSHAHGDHFSASMLNAMLAKQPELRLFAPAQALEQLREHADWDEAFATRISAIELENGEAAAPLEVAGVSIEAFRSPHNGWPENHANVHNISYRVAYGGAADGSALRVMHLGDAGGQSDYYDGLEEFLAAKRTGLVIMPFWFYKEDQLDDLIEDTLNAQDELAVHVPARVPKHIEEGERPYFSKVGEQVEIPATR